MSPRTKVNKTSCFRSLPLNHSLKHGRLCEKGKLDGVFNKIMLE